MIDFTETDARIALGLNAKAEVGIAVDWNASLFRGVECLTDPTLPAAVFVDWYEPSPDPYERDEHGYYPPSEQREQQFSVAHAREAMASILKRADAALPIDIRVNPHAFLAARAWSTQVAA